MEEEMEMLEEMLENGEEELHGTRTEQFRNP
jgi:hypothetical protein